MKAITILKKVVREEYPDFKNFRPEEQTNIIDNIISSYLLPVIKRINLPDIIKLQFKIKQEEYHEKRRRKQTRKKIRQINYALWKLIYDAKLSLESNNIQTIENTSLGLRDVNTTHQIQKYSDETFDKILDPTSSTSQNQYHKFDTPLTLSTTLEEKILNDESYKTFISSIDIATRSKSVKQLGVAEYYLEEEQDLLQDTQFKIILHVKFYGGDYNAKISKWETLRDVLDSYLNNISKTSKIENIIDNFYVKLLP